jgi:hypothetical protein
MTITLRTQAIMATWWIVSAAADAAASSPLPLSSFAQKTGS